MDNKKINFEMCLEFNVDELLKQTSTLIMGIMMQRENGILTLRNGYLLEDLEQKLNIHLSRLHDLKEILNLPTKKNAGKK